MSERTTTYGVIMEEEAIRWVDLTLGEIAALAHHQISGDFGPVSDALTALHLIEALAQRLKDPLSHTI